MPKRFGNRHPRPDAIRSLRVISPSARCRVHYDEPRFVEAVGGGQQPNSCESDPQVANLAGPDQTRHDAVPSNAVDALPRVAACSSAESV